MTVRSVALAEVATLDRRGIESGAIPRGTLYVGLENMASGGGLLDVRGVTDGELASNKFEFTAEHVLYGKLRPYLAKVARPDFRGVCSTDIVPLKAGPDLDRNYLAHFLIAPATVAWAAARSAGVNLPRLSPEQLSRIRVPLPPLPEQRRIAAILDKADALRAKRRAALAKLDGLAQAIFVEMFGDPVANPMGWPRKTIAQIAKVVTGNTPPRATPEYYGAEIEWIKSDNINTPHYYLTRADEGLSAAGIKVARLAPAGSILVTCIAGSPACIGNAAMADREVAFNQQINAVIPSEGDPHFWYAQLVVGQTLIQRAATPGMKGMVSKGRLEQVVVMCPPVELQSRFGGRVLAAEGLAETHRSALGSLDALFSSLQHQAFCGEL